jgi:transposase
MAQLLEDRARSERAQRTCMTLLQSEIDIAFFYLRLAEAETRGGKAGHAAELMAKAILVHKTVLGELEGVSATVQEEKYELVKEARRLLESIQAVERRFRML